MKQSWWKEAVIYQIYPRSFYDSNGDGIGDLNGIRAKLPYLAELGVDVLWLSPIFKSPNDDNGYDISDYCDIMDEFGTMSDFDLLLSTAHSLGLKIVLDLVVNHSSDEHAWFQQSRQSADNPYSDYYIWKKEKPNNWQAFFGGDAWTFDKVRGEYYLHLFTVKQPDLNWENESLRSEVYQMMKFWFDKGIDGFRMDVIPFISKRLDFPPATSDNYMDTVSNIYANGPRIHEFLKEMYDKVTSQYDVLTVGEGIGVNKEQANLYVGESRGELNMIYHFDHLFIGLKNGYRFEFEEWDLGKLKAAFREWHLALGEEGWVNLCLDNHDFPRMVSRYGHDGTYRAASAKLLAILLLSMRGTPCIYQGTEIGMTNVAFPDLEDYDDVETKNFIRIKSAEGMEEKEMLWRIQKGGRDNARTPVQWDDTAHAGFTKATPWLKLNPNYPSINVKNALANPDSIFYFYQKMLSFRKAHKTLVYGDYKEQLTEHPQLYVYERFDAADHFLIILNFSSSEQPIKSIQKGKLMLSNNTKAAADTLAPWEGRIYQV